jgi:C-terminal processing protease CtpA/Prc
VEQPGGTARTVALDPIPNAEHDDWAGPQGLLQLPHDADVPYLADTEPFTVHEINGGRTLYLRYRQVAPPNVDEAEQRIGAGGVDRLILDLRQNPGGDNGTYGPLLRLIQSFAAEHPGATTVLTDRVTFSAAANLATEIEGSTDAVFMGEPMGGGLNFWNDVSWIDLRTLPIPMRLAVSTRYWEMSTPDDPRLTIEPDVAFPVTAEDYLAGRDPVLEAAMQR